MIRNLKLLALALVAVLAMSAMLVSAASAQTGGKLTVNGGSSATLDGTENGANSFTAFGSIFECPGSTVKGHKITTTPHVAVPANATEITLTPLYTNCVLEDGFGKHKVTVTMTSCDYQDKLGETTGGVPNTYAINFGVACTTPGDTIDIEAYAFAGSELGGIQCTYKVKPQENLTGLHLTTTTASDEIDVEGTVTGLHAERSGAGCATETTTTAQQHVNVTGKGTNAVSAPTGITVTH